MPNAIRIISPYRYDGTWVFDDEATGLVREPFVAGIPEMIEVLLAETAGPDGPPAESIEKFRLLFSDRPFPGSQRELIHVRPETGGHWYRTDDPPMEGWLCPALFKYFDEAPERIHVKAELIER